MENKLNELANILKEAVAGIDLNTSANIVFVERFQNELEKNGLSPELAEDYASFISVDLAPYSIDDPDIDTAITSLSEIYAKAVFDIDTFWRNKNIHSTNVYKRVKLAISSMTLSI